MAEVVIRDSTIGDVHAIVAQLRAADRAEIEAMGFQVRQLLRANFRGALIRKTALVDGEIAAVYGVYCDCLANVGYPYLLTTKSIEKIPLACVKEGKKAIASMLRIVPRLEGSVDASYDKACRLLDVLGFQLGNARPLGPRDVAFRDFSLTRG